MEFPASISQLFSANGDFQILCEIKVRNRHALQMAQSDSLLPVKRFYWPGLNPDPWGHALIARDITCMVPVQIKDKNA